MATISGLPRDHVTLRVGSVDRLFLQGYVPRLMCEGQVIRFLLDQGNPIPSPALLGKIGRAYVERIDRFALGNGVPVVRFRKGDCKEELARPYLERAEAEGRTGVVMIGTAQEKASAWRGWRDGGPDGHPTSRSGARRCLSTTTTFGERASYRRAAGPTARRATGMSRARKLALRA